MDENSRKEISNILLESYKARVEEDATCVICSNKNRPMFFNAIKYYQAENLIHPEIFIPHSGSFGTVRGCFPICTSCVKPCRKCSLPILSENFQEAYIKLKKKYPEGLNIGNVVCAHMHMSLLFHAIYKRIFGIGRFKK